MFYCPVDSPHALLDSNEHNLRHMAARRPEVERDGRYGPKRAHRAAAEVGGLCSRQAEVVLAQLRETAAYRGWELLAASIMANHFHLVVAVADDAEPRKVLADFKAYGTRALNRAFGRLGDGRRENGGRPMGRSENYRTNERLLQR